MRPDWHSMGRSGALLLATIALAVPAYGLPLYVVDFGSPPHTVGQPPATGAGAIPRETASSVSGTPEVVSSLGTLTSQPCAFDAGFQVVEFDLTDLDASDTYRFTGTILVQPSTQEFSYIRVSLTTPSVRNVDFNGSGAVSAALSSSTIDTVATFTPGTPVDVQIDVDLSLDTWSIRLDGKVVHQDSFGGATSIETVRVTSTATLAFIVSGAVDDITIESELEVPAVRESWGAVKDHYRLDAR